MVKTSWSSLVLSVLRLSMKLARVQATRPPQGVADQKALTRAPPQKLCMLLYQPSCKCSRNWIDLQDSHNHKLSTCSLKFLCVRNQQEKKSRRETSGGWNCLGWIRSHEGNWEPKWETETCCAFIWIWRWSLAMLCIHRATSTWRCRSSGWLHCPNFWRIYQGAWIFFDRTFWRFACEG